MHRVVLGALTRGHDVLLVHRRPDKHAYPNVWDLPGGLVEPGESDVEALVRELHEELGVEVAPTSADRLCEVTVGTDNDQVVLSGWLVREWRGAPVNAAPEEHDDIAWFGVDDLPPPPHPEMRAALLDALRDDGPRRSAGGQPVCQDRLMTSWRDTASASAQDDLDGLLNLVLPLAQELLGKNGQFYPFGASVSTDGEASLTAADPGLGDNPRPDQVLAGVYDGARATADEHRAVAFVSDVLVAGADAVQVELEHREGVALVVLVPYKPATLKRVPTFRDMSVAPGEPRVWAAG